ncbi:MAG: aminotransferase class-iii [Deltaproteobacteria bacterium RIFCSPLOWO2_02_FULL_53_8]|nr:MAG: aminotransferase class-iii [Deltaproteobacteria bacterium RIFCSPLOWO2_02_FULL_53_8]
MHVNEYRKKLLNRLRLDIDVVRASGNQLYTRNGTIVRDYLAQYGALPFGHNPPFAIAAVTDYLNAEQPVFMQPNIHRDAIALATKLGSAVGPGYTRCVFTNSGAETVEAAIKLARMRTGRKHILSVVRGFHGKTYAALSASGSRRFKTEHIHDAEAYTHISMDDAATLERELSSGRYAAFIIEPVQGEGGMCVVDAAYLRAAVELCAHAGTMSIFDEIQTGLGRTGHLCVATQYTLKPDMLLFSKALGAGVIPIGALLCRETAYTAEFDRKHSSTFANNGLAATAGMAVLNKLLMDDSCALRHVQDMGRLVDKHLERITADFPAHFTAQGVGLMRGLELRDPAATANLTVNFCQNSGALAYVICGYLLHRHNMFTMPLMSQPCSIRFEPPLNVTEEDIDHFFHAFTEVCNLLKNGRYDILFSHLIEKNPVSCPPPELCFPVSELPDLAKTIDAGCTLNKGKKFAFLIHGTSMTDNIRSFPYAIRANYSQDELNALCQQIMGIAAIDFAPDIGVEFGVKSATSYANGMLIFTPLGPEEMLALPRHEKINLLKQYLDIAHQEGVEIVGLGAYTSVISRGGEMVLPIAGDAIITTGNSLTALSTVESIKSLGQQARAPQQIAAVIGARGSVGKVVVMALAHSYGRIILVGRKGGESDVLHAIMPSLFQLAVQTDDQVLPGSVFYKIRHWLAAHGLNVQAPLHDADIKQRIAALALEALAAGENIQCGVWADCDHDTVLKSADCIISATSEGKPFLGTLNLKPNAIVFDAARPFDFHRDSLHHIYEGGLVSQPGQVNYSDCNMVGTPSGVNLACLSETLALALDRVETHQSVGQNIDYQSARKILKIARQHGFEPMQYKTAGTNLEGQYAA